jgi:hypothetical protein
MRSLQEPVEIINNIAPALKPSGKLVIIEQEEGRAVGTDGNPQPAGWNRTRREYLDLFSQTAFQVDGVDETTLPYDIIFVLSGKRRSYQKASQSIARVIKLTANMKMNE